MNKILVLNSKGCRSTTYFSTPNSLRTSQMSLRTDRNYNRSSLSCNPTVRVTRWMTSPRPLVPHSDTSEGGTEVSTAGSRTARIRPPRAVATSNVTWLPYTAMRTNSLIITCPLSMFLWEFFQRDVQRTVVQ